MNLTDAIQFSRKFNVKGKDDMKILSNLAGNLEPNFQMDEITNKFYKQMFYYFSKDDKFEGNLNKGLLLMGKCGNGKTLAMRIFQIYNLLKHNSFYLAIHDEDEIITTFSIEGRKGIETFNYDYDLVIDDIGNNTGKHSHFGSTEDPIEILLSRRYIKFSENAVRTHATSNLNIPMLEDRFSDRVFDRMCEMFNFIVVEGDSWRRKK